MVLNLPVTTPTGLDMPPLSWYVFGVHMHCVSHMLDIPEVDVNRVFRDEKGGRITVRDVCERMVGQGGGGGGRGCAGLSRIRGG